MSVRTAPHMVRQCIAVMIPMAWMIMATGCGNPERKALSELHQPVSLVLFAGTADAGGPWADLLRPATSSIPFFAEADLILALELATREQRVVILADPSRLQPSSAETLAAWMADGGKVLWCGRLRDHSLFADSTHIPLLAPAAHRYVAPSAAHRLLDPLLGTSIPVEPLTVESPIPITGAWGPPQENQWRWVPLIAAKNMLDDTIAWPVSLYLAETPDTSSPTCHGWIGFDPSPSHIGVAWAMLNRALAAMTEPVHFLSAGLSQHSYTHGDALTVSATWTLDRQHDPQPVRVAVEFINRRGQVMRRIVSPPVPASDLNLDLEIGVVPDPGTTPDTYTLVIYLRDQTDSQSLDRIARPIKMFPSGNLEEPSTPIDATGANLTEGRRPVFLLGINYQPLPHDPRPAANASWLAPPSFNGDLFARDVRQLATIGFNTVAFSYTARDQAPQVNWVLDELREQNLRATLRVPGLDPLDQDLPLAATLLEAIRPDLWPVVALIESDLSPHGFGEQDLAALEPAWLQWLSDRWGDPQTAWLTLIPDSDPEPSSPSPTLEDLTDEAHRIGLAYRHFLRDTIQHGFGQAAEQIRRLGIPTLLTSRVGTPTMTSPSAAPVLYLDPILGAIHLDAVGAIAVDHDFADLPEDTARAFPTRYARGISGGKPALWLQAYPTAAETNVHLFIQRNLDTAFRMEAAGWFYPQLYSAINSPQHPDLSLLYPDGTLRPVASKIQAFKHRLRLERAAILPWRGRTFPAATFQQDHPDRLWNWHTGAYSLEAVRPDGFQTSVDDVLRRLDAPFGLDPTPLGLIHANWRSYRIDDAPGLLPFPPIIHAPENAQIEWTLVNAGSATWPRPGTQQQHPLLLVARHTSGRVDTLRIGAAAMGESTTVAWRPRVAGTWEIQPWIEGLFPIGSRKTVEVSPENSP